MSTAVSGTADGPRSTRAASRLWILNSWQDLVLFIATPVLIVPLVWWAHRRFTVEQISLFVAAFGATGHHLPGLLRAYGDRELFQQYRVRFLVAPLVIVTVCLLFAQYDLQGLLVILLLWGFWHGLMQVYGFVRIYDAKVQSVAALTARLDFLMCLAWFGAGMLFSPGRMEHLLRVFYKAGGPLIPAWALSGVQTAWAVATLLISLAFAAHYILQLRRGTPPNPIKLLLMGTSFGFWWFAMVGVRSVLLGVALFEIFHDVQYLSIVWVYNRNRVARGAEVGSFTRFLFRRSGALMGLYVGLVFAYGFLGILPYEATQHRIIQMLFGLMTASALLHFYYDGFIWKVRHQRTREGLDLDGGGADRRSERVPSWLTHGLKWAFFLVPAAYLGLSEYWLGGLHLDAFRSLAELTPTSWRAQAQLGEALLQEGRPAEAVPPLQRALELHPGLDLTHCDLGRALVVQGQLDEAATHFRQALELNPNLALAHCELGKLLFRQGQTDDGLTALEEAVRLRPDDATAHLWLAKAFVTLRRPAEAHREFEEALRCDAALADAYLERSRLSESEGQRDSAFADCDRALEIAPQWAAAWRWRAQLRLRAGQPEQALADLRESRRFEPPDAATLVQCGTLRYQLGQYDEALADFRRAAELDAGDPEPLRRLAMALVSCPRAELRDGPQAVRAAERACELTQGRDPLSLQLLAAAFFANGQTADGERTLARVLELVPPAARPTIEKQLDQFKPAATNR